MTIKTVFFDVGMTLIEPAVSEALVLAEAAASCGVAVEVDEVERSIPAMYEYYEEMFRRDNSIWADDARAEEIWISMYGYLCELVGIAEIGAQVARQGYERFLDPASWQLFADVLPTLDALRGRGVSLGIISNWDSSLERIIAGVGVADYFDVLVSSAVVGLHKPQPEIFEFALTSMGAKSAESMYVGDHVDADVKGAMLAGIAPVLIDREGRHTDGDGYVRIHDLRDVLKYV
ncbi:MAG: HAD-IA family hydrolase [Coriobacteriia bacterium]|nr:HAD-IA family hydrolase [Coriobacteriia bacterium]